MKRVLLGMLFAAAVAGTAAAVPFTVTFEEPSLPTGIGTWFSGSGVVFDPGWQLLTPTLTYPAHSGTHIVYSVGPTAWINFIEPVRFVDAWFTTTSNAFPGLHMEAYSGLSGTGTLIDTATMLKNARSIDPMRVESPNGEIMSVVIHDTGNAFTMDDVTFDPVPEPATISLLLAAIGLTILRKRRE